MSDAECKTCAWQVLQPTGFACRLDTCNWQVKLPSADPWIAIRPGRGHIASYQPRDDEA